MGELWSAGNGETDLEVREACLPCAALAVAEQPLTPPRTDPLRGSAAT